MPGGRGPGRRRRPAPGGLRGHPDPGAGPGRHRGSRDRKAAAPFAVNSFFAGPDSINAQFATDSRRDRAGGVTLAQRFAPAAGPPLALPLAAGRGYWLVGVFSQTSIYHSATGTRKASWPDGSSIASPRPAVVHQETDTFVTTYTATDPLRLARGRVLLDGFFGWPVTDIAR